MENMNFERIIKAYEEKGVLKKRTIVDAFIETAQMHGNKIAIYDTEACITYADLEKRTAQFAEMLVKQKVNTGDRVLLHVANSIFYVVSLLGTMRAGAVPVLLLQEHHENEIVSIGNTTEAVVMVAGYSDYNEDWEGMIGRSLNCIPTLKTLITDVIFQADCRSDIRYITEKDLNDYCGDFGNFSISNIPAVFLLSGGTTGVPKIIPKLQEAYLYNIEKCMERCGYSEETVYLTPLSVSHDFALANPGLLGALLAGGTGVLLKTPFFDEAFELIEKYNVNTVTLVPALISAWLEGVDFCENDLSSWKVLITGAAKIDEKLGFAAMDKFGVKIINGYGLGEGISCFTSLDDEADVVFHSQGKPISEYDVMKIIDENSNELPQGEIGELAETGPYTFGGYYKNEALNREVFTTDGLFRTGDKAKIDDKGNLVILGRVREQINRAGENVIPSEIEEYLRKCPGVVDASVFGIPDSVLGEKTIAVIIGEKVIKRKEISDYMLEQGIAAYKIPDEVYLMDEFPYKNIGKVDKVRLREIVITGKE